MELTDKWLMDIGGWAEMKEARRLFGNGAVQKINANSRQIRAQVRDGNRAYKAILVIGGALGASAVCGCPVARRDLICRHALAAGLAHLNGCPKSGSPATSAPAKAGPSSRPVDASQSADPAPHPLTVELAPDWLERLLPTSGRSAPLPLQIKRDSNRQQPDPADARLWQWLTSMGQGQARLPALLQVSRDQVDPLFAALAGHPKVISPESIHWRFSTQTIAHPLQRVVIQNHEDASELANEDTEIEIRRVSPEDSSSNHAILLGAQRAWLQLPGHKVMPLARWPESAAGTDIPNALDGPDQRWRGPLRQLARSLPFLDDAVEWVDEAPAWTRFRVRPARPRAVVAIEGSLRSVDLRLHVLYNDGTLRRVPGRNEPDDTTEFPYPDSAHPGLWHLRHPAAELDVINEVEKAGFSPNIVDGQPAWRLSGEEQVLAWTLDILPAWQRDWQVQLGERWRHQVDQLAIVRPHLSPLDSDEPIPAPGSGVDWFGFSLSYRAGGSAGVEMSRQDVLRLLRSGRRTARLPNGKRLVLDRSMVEQTEAALTDADVRLGPDGRGAVDPRQTDYLDAVSDGLLTTQLTQWARTRPQEELQPLLPDPLISALRDYQWHGLAWLDRLGRSRRGGILADEMGLGKTVQTLAWLALLHGDHAQSDEQRRPSLVVCPTSLLGNWQDEAGRWTPHLRPHIHHGSTRRPLADCQADLVITSYGVLARDLKDFAAIDFAAVVLDEASVIKNPDTRLAKAVGQLRADTRLALSGTPVENSVRDLWSILTFAMPGYLGGRKEFRERFEKPLTSTQPDPAVMRRLKLRLAPYVLRRRKNDVATELPQRIEQVRRVDPTARQAELYRRILTASQEEIAATRRRGGREAARMTMFTALLRLRQVCNDPSLLPRAADAAEPPADASSSGKWPAFDDWLAEIRDDGGKAIVFSQFTSMLRLLRRRLEAAEVSFSYLDGSTTDRDQQVRRFQQDPCVTVFLVSLKAGGYGLNLTAANHVLLVDPWWNPAVEAQAIDRAHRIGQQQVVMATRLVTRGTVEEKILELQARKRAVFDAALDDDQPLMQGLSDDDLQDLLT